MTPPGGADGSVRPGRGLVRKSVLILISAALVVYLLMQVDARAVLDVIVRFPVGYLFCGFVLFIAGHFVRALRFRILLGSSSPVKGLFRIIAVQTAAVGFLPFRAGEFSLIYLLKREQGVDYAKGAAVLMLSKALDFLVVLALFFVSFSTLTAIPDFYRELMPWAGGLFLVSAAALFMMGRAREIYARLPGFFKEGPLAEGKLMTGVKKVFKGAEVIRSKSTLLASFGVTLVLWVLLYGSSFFIYYGLGLNLALLEMVFITTSMSLFANLPIHSPGGFGTVESFWTILLMALGIPKTVGIPTGFTSHLVSTLFTLVFMLYGLGLLKKRKALES